MPLVETESLVLRSYDLAEADRIVVFFTRDHGIVRGVAKGAKRLKSRFGSTLEPFSTVNLAYFQKEERELVSVQNVELTCSRFDSAAAPEFLHTFSYLADLLIALVPPHDPSEVVYRMTRACLDAGSGNDQDLAGIRLYFELWLLRLGGYLPNWAGCSQCGVSLDGPDEAFLRSDSSLSCTRCTKAGRERIGSVHRTLYFNAQRLAPPDFLSEARHELEGAAELSAIMRRLVAAAAGRDLIRERFVTAVRA